MPSKYPYVLATQVAMLSTDVLFNALSVVCYGNNMLLLLIYILQDTLLIMSALVLFVSFTATFVFQLGLIHVVIFQFLPTVIVAILYIMISIGYHYASLSTTWNDQSLNIFLSNYLLLAFFTLHKVVSCIFYSYYKRTALQISDPKYNSDSAWLRDLFLKHMANKEARKAARAARAANG